MASTSDPNANRGPQTLAIVGAFTGIAGLGVILRLWTRCVISKNSAIDDIYIIVALLFSLATTVCTVYEVKNGMGRHMDTLTMEDVMGYNKFLYLSILMYNFGLLFTKLSILWQYKRIAANRRMRMICWAAIAFVVAYGLQTFLTGVFTCYPIPKNWDLRVEGGCVNRFALYYANGGLNIFSDLLILVLPVFLLKGLMLPTRQKVALMFIMGFGGVACVASIFRLYIIYRFTNSQDLTWDNAAAAYWSSIELNLGIFCSSLSTIRPLVVKFMPHMFRSRTMTNPYPVSSQLRDNLRRKSHKHSDSSGSPKRIRVQTDIEIGMSSYDIPELHSVETFDAATALPIHRNSSL